MPRRLPHCAPLPQSCRGRDQILRGLICASALVGGAAQAETTATDVLTLPAISVKGSGTQDPAATTVVHGTAASDKLTGRIIDVPASVTAITQKEIANRKAGNLTQALSFTSSVSVDEYGSDTRYDYFRIRGFAETGTGVYLDGLPEPTLNYTGAILEPYGLERLDVLKGSTSSLFGMNEPGGMVNAVSKRPTDHAFGEAYTTLGKRHAEAGFDMGGPLNASGTLSYRLTAKWQDAKQDTKYENDNRRYFAPALTWKPNAQTSLTVLLKYQQDDGSSGNAIPYGMSLSNHKFYGEPDYDGMNRTQRSIGYAFHHDFGNGLSFDQNARYSDVDLSYNQVYLSSYASTGRAAYGVDGSLKSFNIDSHLQYDHDFGQIRSKTLLGYEFDHYDLQENSVYGTAGAIDLDDPSYCGLACINVAPYTSSATTTLVSGLYLQEQLTLAERWILTLGAREDWVKTDTGTEATTNSQSAFTRRIGLTWKARPNLSLYANYSESFDPTASAYATLTTSAIKPSRGRQGEVGAKWQPKDVNGLLTFSLFNIHQSNVLKENPDYSYSQQGEIGVKGAELEGRFAVNDRLNLTFAYSYWDAKIMQGDNPGNRPYLVPKQLASAWVDYTFPASGRIGAITLGGGLRYLGGRYSDDANTMPIPGVVLTNVMARYQLSDHNALQLNISNLFDRKYVSSISSDAAALYYGNRRTVFLTLKHSW